jgi:putative oxidoreductase
MSSLRRLMNSTAPVSIVLIRIAVGTVFLSAGIQKFLFPNEPGVVRLVKICIPAPE